MKRVLADYATSSDDDSNYDEAQPEVRTQQPTQQSATVEKLPVAKRRRAELVIQLRFSLTKHCAEDRRLPALHESLLSPTPIDNPALHQGRKRAQPHVEGNWPTHVYIPIPLSSNPKLWALLKTAMADAKGRVPELHTFLNGHPDDTSGAARDAAEIHISLSRPLFLRAHQRDNVKKAVKRIANSSAPFRSSFACFTMFTNDEKTRSFLSVEIGAGHAECQTLSSGLSSILEELRQEGYYLQPRFHASFAWALLSTSPVPPPGDATLSDESSSPPPISQVSAPLRHSQTNSFPSVRALPPELVDYLEGTYGAELRRVGRIDVQNVSIKIGKDVSSWPLAGTD